MQLLLLLNLEVPRPPPPVPLVLPGSLGAGSGAGGPELGGGWRRPLGPLTCPRDADTRAGGVINIYSDNKLKLQEAANGHNTRQHKKVGSGRSKWEPGEPGRAASPGGPGSGERQRKMRNI